MIIYSVSRRRTVGKYVPIKYFVNQELAVEFKNFMEKLHTDYKDAYRVEAVDVDESEPK